MGRARVVDPLGVELIEREAIEDQGLVALETVRLFEQRKGSLQNANRLGFVVDVKQAAGVAEQERKLRLFRREWKDSAFLVVLQRSPMIP